MLFETKENFINESNGIILVLTGGLGNQLFVYAAGKAMQKHLDKPLYLMLDDTVYDHTKTDYRKVLFNDVEHIERNDIRMQNKIDITVQGKHKLSDPWSVYTVPKRTYKYLYIESEYFQYFPAIVNIISDVRNTLHKNLKARYPNMHIHSDSCFLHVRRGDFINHSEEGIRNSLLDMDYFSKALKYLDNKGNNTLYIFSEDLEWCKTQIWDSDKEIIYIDEPDELKTLYMMSLCKGGAIISNSSFSTWGAILGAYERGSPIIYPKKWMFDANLNFPEDWIKI